VNWTIGHFPWPNSFFQNSIELKFGLWDGLAGVVWYLLPRIGIKFSPICFETEFELFELTLFMHTNNLFYEIQKGWVNFKAFIQWDIRRLLVYPLDGTHTRPWKRANFE